VRPLARLVSLVRAEVAPGVLERLRSAGAEAYQLIDQAPAGSWERLAAWNAFIHQIYGDNLLANDPARAVPVDTARIVVQLYELAAAWLDRASQLRESPGSRLQVDLRTTLPHWRTPLRTRDQLSGMRTTLDDARIRVASELAAFADSGPARERLRARLSEIESRIETVDLLWVGRGSDEIRGAIGDALSTGLDEVSVLGQLLARPALVETLAT
jgi:hypothetical protein